jgi:dihydrofolate reductase
MIISAIVAASNNMCIGIDNQLPWRMPNDLKYFKNTTEGHCVVMGRKTFESIGKPLVDRTNVVLSRNPYFSHDGIDVFNNSDDVLKFCEANEFSQVFIIGGSEIYQQFFNKLDYLYLTKIDTEINGTSFFPELNWDEWVSIYKDKNYKDDKHEYDYSFNVYKKILI